MPEQRLHILGLQTYTLPFAGGAENLTSHYILLLGMYRLFYLLNWIYRKMTEDDYMQLIVWLSGARDAPEPAIARAHRARSPIRLDRWRAQPAPPRAEGTPCLACPLVALHAFVAPHSCKRTVVPTKFDRSQDIHRF
eukprot:4885418-Pleurochrysis_carterae.AAC.1